MPLLPNRPRDSGFRKTVGIRIKRPISHRLQVLSQVFFDNSHAGAVETTFAEFCIARGFIEQDAKQQPKFPLAELQTSQAVGESLDDFLVVVDALSMRLESLHARGRIAVVDPNHVLAFVRAAEAFPGRMRAPRSVEIDLFDQEGFSFTLNPKHIEKIDEVGVRMFERDRKRRAVIEEALVWFATEHGMSDVVHEPCFAKYPSISLMHLNRYFDRHVLALLAAMHPLAEGVGRYRLWSAVERSFTASTFRLGNALFSAVRRDPCPRA